MSVFHQANRPTPITKRRLFQDIAATYLVKYKQQTLLERIKETKNYNPVFMAEGIMDANLRYMDHCQANDHQLYLQHRLWDLAVSREFTNLIFVCKVNDEHYQ